MDLGPQHLRMIAAVATAGSISKAAAHLELTQPAVSTMLGRVETHLGIRLFTRSAEGVSVTPVGTEVVSRARAILAGIDELDLAVRGPGARPTVPRLRIGGQIGPVLEALIPRLPTLFPTLRTQLRVEPGGGRLLSLLASGALEIAIMQELVTEPGTVPAGVERHVLIAAEPEFVGLAEHSPLAAQEEVDLASLAQHEWIDDPLDDGPWPAYFRRCCAQAGFTPTVNYWTGHWDFSASLIRSGRAVGIYHPTARPRAGVAFRRLVGDPLMHRVVLLWRREWQSTALRLRSELGRVYPDLVTANPVYARWWDEHPEAHPTLPSVGDRQK